VARDEGLPMTSTSPSPLTLTARSPEDLLALAPVVLGFFPTESVVMLTFGAAAPFHARVDLPDDASGVTELVDALVAPAQHHAVERVVLLLYGSDLMLSRRVWHALRHGFERCGIRVVEAMRVTEERWYPLTGSDQLARRTGIPYDISAHPFLVQAVVDGRVTHGSRDALAATLAPDPDAVRRTEGLLRGASVPGDLLTAGLLSEGLWLESVLTEHLERGSVPDDPTLARVLLDLAHLGLRDAAWSTISRPRSRAAVALWTHAVTRCPDRLVAAPAALLAWSAWLHGNGALAWCGVDLCEGADPGYGLARIVAELLEAAHPPSAWCETIDWKASLDQPPRAG